MKRAAVALALFLAAPAHASDAAVGLAPVGLIVPVAVVGGAVTTVILGLDIADETKVHPAFRNFSLGFAGVNVLAGSGAIVAAAVTEDDDLDALLYGVGGGVLALGVVGGALALAVDTYEPANHVQLQPTVGGAMVGWSGTF